MRDGFEATLRDHPDHLGAWSAYADWLTEQGDPRGEFMQVQLALEDESRSKAERDGLRTREAELLKEHERTWLGELAEPCLDAEPIYANVKWVEHRFDRGWLSALTFNSLTVDMARRLARSPEANLLSRIAVQSAAFESPTGVSIREVDLYYEPGPDVPAGLDEFGSPSLYALAHVPQLAGLRVFTLGEGSDAPYDPPDAYHSSRGENAAMIDGILARTPRLEELYLYGYDAPAAAVFALPLPHLRVLRFENADEYPLDVLAANPTLDQLTHLLCHPHAQRAGDQETGAYLRPGDLRAVCRSPHLSGLTHLRLRLTDFGDDGIDEIITSGLLRRLRWLDLKYGCVTDRGAAALAACPDLKNLAFLDLSWNALTETGIEALKATGVPVDTADQHDEHPDKLGRGEDDYLDYLGYGDIE